MKRKESSLMSILLIVLCLNSIVYYDIQYSDIENEEEFLDMYPINEFEIEYDSLPDDDSFLIKKETIPGNYITKGFFSYDDILSSPLDSDGISYEWTDYEGISQVGWGGQRARFGVGTIGINRYPPSDDFYIKGYDMWQILENSTMFSPTLTQNTTITDKVHYLVNIHRHSTETMAPYTFKTMDITFKITLHHFFSSNSSTEEILSTEFILDEIIPSQSLYWKNYHIESTIDEYTIPSGDRLKVTYELKYENSTATQGHITINAVPDGLLYENGIETTNVVWDIVDGVVHSNTYIFEDTDGILGVQLYMTEDFYPDVDIIGVENNTVYQTSETITIDVTDNSSSSYRWDGGSWNSFENDTSTQIPTTHGWHYLEVSSSDLIYDNTRIEMIKVGYDASYDNLLLNNAFSGEKIAGGFVLNFSTLNVDTVNYTWDGSETPVVLNSPYDITTSLYNGLHNLTVNTTDFYKERIFNFHFYFDSDSPTILLDNVANNTFLLGGKTIEIEILDYSDFSVMNYSWDSGSVQNWVQDPSNIYNTIMPTTNGSHYLDIYIEDEFNHFTTEHFVFYTDVDVFFVDLKYMNNNSYYFGGNDVELIIQKSNTTVYYAWNGNPETKDVVPAEILLLNGGDALPNIEGLHNLTIRSFDIFDVSYNYTFFFYVDKTAPVIDASILAYNNTRTLKDGVSFTFYITDDVIPTDDLLVQYSIDSDIYEFFDTRFVFPLFRYADGLHSLDILVKDKAGNQNITRIYFTIDTTAPSILSDLEDIPELYDDSEHGNYYIPADSFIEPIIIDVDPGLRTFYSWDGEIFIEFIDNFTLSSIDKKAVLVIMANDTVGNEANQSIELIYDSSPPIVNLLKPIIPVAINNRTSLEFIISGETSYSLLSVEYEWDVDPGLIPLYPKLNGEFDLKMSEFLAWFCDINNVKDVKLYITATDVLGNVNTTEFEFQFDLSPPLLSLFIFDGTYFNIQPNGTTYPVQGSTALWYNASVNDDLNTFQYYWDNDESPTFLDFEIDPYGITVPDADGNHTLMIILTDNTGGGGGDTISPNIYVANFTFLVDDISVSYIIPIGFESEYPLTMEYNDTFTYQVNVTDSVNHEMIDELQVLITYETFYNFDIIVQNVSSVYTVTIHATDATNSLETNVKVRFYQASVTSGQEVIVLLTVNKKMGNLTILEESDTSVEYYGAFEIVLNFQNDLGDNLTIDKLFLNGTEETDFISTETECRLNYSTVNIGHKGNFSLVINTESLYYYSTPNINTTIELEIRPIPTFLDVWVSNTTILEGQLVEIFANLTYIDGSPIPLERIHFLIYVYYKNDTTLTPTQLKLAFTDWNYTVPDTDVTDLEGTATITFLLEENIAYIGIEASFAGTNILDIIETEFESLVITYPPIIGGLPQWLLYVIIGGSIGVAAIISLIIYKVTRPKSFEELMERVIAEDIALNYSIMSPGVILTIFDQRKGPIPLVADHSLDIGRYIGRMRIGVENFLLKIADQAYSSLGFEEHDAGRRVGSIILPTEKMVAFVHGLQLENKMARGGFENLSLIVLADSEFGNLLLNYQEFLYELVDDLSSVLKSKKNLKVVEEAIVEIRKRSVIIMLAAQEMEKAQNGD
ncbi:MAG: hypothetical protein ACTSO5_05915 [Candidatus Heimdallarchaeaceae archaeon]